MALPIFVATHPRACSTAFERVFMTRKDDLATVHEPFGDAFYFGPERLSERYEDDPEARTQSGFAEVTFRDVLEGIEKAGCEGKRIFIKDIAHYLFAPDGKHTSVAPSLTDGAANGVTLSNGTNGVYSKTNGVTAGGTNGARSNEANGTHVANSTNGINGINGHPPANPTVLPDSALRRFQFAFLIRHPRRAIPSYYRCTVPPLNAVTGFDNFMPSEAGYDELRRLFDYVVASGIVARDDIVVLDADDLLDKPAESIRAFCDKVGLQYRPEMLAWGDGDNELARVAFKKWEGFHLDALQSKGLHPRSHASKSATAESEDSEWRAKFGDDGQRAIRQCVEANVPHYEYLKSFALVV